jgi:hypothetical protein
VPGAVAVNMMPATDDEKIWLFGIGSPPSMTSSAAVSMDDDLFADGVLNGSSPSFRMAQTPPSPDRGVAAASGFGDAIPDFIAAIVAVGAGRDAVAVIVTDPVLQAVDRLPAARPGEHGDRLSCWSAPDLAAVVQTLAMSGLGGDLTTDLVQDGVLARAPTSA